MALNQTSITHTLKTKNITIDLTGTVDDNEYYMYMRTPLKKSPISHAFYAKSPEQARLLALKYANEMLSNRISDLMAIADKIRNDLNMALSEQ